MINKILYLVMGIGALALLYNIQQSLTIEFTLSYNLIMFLIANLMLIVVPVVVYLKREKLSRKGKITFIGSLCLFIGISFLTLAQLQGVEDSAYLAALFMISGLIIMFYSHRLPGQ